MTPPIKCGLLAGTMREELIERGELIERVLKKEDVKNASEIKLFNSVRKQYPAKILD